MTPPRCWKPNCRTRCRSGRGTSSGPSRTRTPARCEWHRRRRSDSMRSGSHGCRTIDLPDRARISGRPRCRKRSRRGCGLSVESQSELISDRHRNDAPDAADGLMANRAAKHIRLPVQPVDGRRNRSVRARRSKGVERRIVGGRLVGFRRLCPRRIARVRRESGEHARQRQIVVLSKTPRTDILPQIPWGRAEIARTLGEFHAAFHIMNRAGAQTQSGIARNLRHFPLEFTDVRANPGMTSRANRRSCATPPSSVRITYWTPAAFSFQRPANLVRLP